MLTLHAFPKKNPTILYVRFPGFNPRITALAETTKHQIAPIIVSVIRHLLTRVLYLVISGLDLNFLEGDPQGGEVVRRLWTFRDTAHRGCFRSLSRQHDTTKAASNVVRAPVAPLVHWPTFSKPQSGPTGSDPGSAHQASSAQASLTSRTQRGSALTRAGHRPAKVSQFTSLGGGTPGFVEDARGRLFS